MGCDSRCHQSRRTQKTRRADIANTDEPAEVERKTMGKCVYASISNAFFQMLTMMTLRPITHMRTGDIPMLRMFLNYFASLVETAHSTVSTNTSGLLNYTLELPFGVTAGM